MVKEVDLYFLLNSLNSPFLVNQINNNKTSISNILIYNSKHIVENKHKNLNEHFTFEKYGCVFLKK